MSKSERIDLEFGVPEHGWLSTTFRYGDFNLELNVSDVPRNPTAQLCDSLIQLLKGVNSPDLVPWHLEPYCYYLKLEKFENNYSVTILESDNFESPKRVTFQIDGDFESTILPIYRSLKIFASKTYKQSHWDELDSDRIEELKRLIKKKKAHNIVWSQHTLRDTPDTRNTLSFINEKKQQYINSNRQLAKRYFDTVALKYEREIISINVNSNLGMIAGVLNKKFLFRRHKQVFIASSIEKDGCDPTDNFLAMKNLNFIKSIVLLLTIFASFVSFWQTNERVQDVTVLSHIVQVDLCNGKSHIYTHVDLISTSNDSDRSSEVSYLEIIPEWDRNTKYEVVKMANGFEIEFYNKMSTQKV